jgi:hypothetical protein
MQTKRWKHSLEPPLWAFWRAAVFLCSLPDIWRKRKPARIDAGVEEEYEDVRTAMADYERGHSHPE